MANIWDNTYEASDEASENELEKSASLRKWVGTGDVEIIRFDIFTACSVGCLNYVKSALQNKIDINGKNKGGWSPLMYACFIGHESIVTCLLEVDVQINAVNKKGQTSLILAAICGNIRTANFLIQAGAAIDCLDKLGRSALYHATYAGHHNMVKLLLDSSANLQIVDNAHGYTPFMEAAAAGNEIIVQYFLQKGVKADYKAFDGSTAHSLATQCGHRKIASLINHHHLQQLANFDLGYHGDKDYSSSDEFNSSPRCRSTKLKHKEIVPGIQDGPHEFAKLIDNKTKKDGSESLSEGPNNCSSSFQDIVTSRDITSPVNSEDLADQDISSSSKDSLWDNEEESNSFTRSGALTIKHSGSSSSGGFAATLGIKTPNPESVEKKYTKTHSENSPSNSYNKGNANKHKRNADHHKRERKRSSGPILHPIAAPVATFQPRIPVQYVTPQLSHVVPKIDMSRLPPGNVFVAPSFFPINISTHPPFEQPIPHYDPTPDLNMLLHSLGLDKYIHMFEEQDVDLSVFLTLTDMDLKEIGVSLFGPRRKMTNAIARWHSNTRSSANNLEQAYADKLEAEMQEMAVKLHQAYEQIESSKARLLQERELRDVAESCIMDDRLSWQHVKIIGASIMQFCGDIHHLMQCMEKYQDELSRRFQNEPPGLMPTSIETTSLVEAIQEGLSLEKSMISMQKDISTFSNQHVIKKIQRIEEEIRKNLALAAMNAEKLAGKDTSSTDTASDESVI